MKKIYLFAAVLMGLTLCKSTTLSAQDWVKLMQDPNVSLSEVQQAFNTYYVAKKAEMLQERIQNPNQSNEELEADENANEVPGYTQFKRWEWWQKARSQNGERVDPTATWKNMQSYFETHNPSTQAGTWTYIGAPNVTGLSGTGRLTFIKVDPTTPTTLWVGSPAGGLWKSTNSGANWTTNTDQLAHVIGCTDIAIDPTNTQIMYLATGDGDAGDNNSVGVLKTTDGGVTWNTTSLSFGVGSYRMISKVKIDPSNSSKIFAATSAGIYRSTDAGVTWTLTQAGSFKDFEFMPGNSNTMYTCGAQFYRSIDNGVTWTLITSGLPAVAAVSRMAIGVSAANANTIYMLVGAAAPNYGLVGFYKSTNAGVTWTQPSTPVNGNQQWYDLCIDVDPTNINNVVIGQQTSLQRSTNGGTSWATITGTTHVDYHDILYTNTTSFYVASDGGLYRTINNGAAWTNLCNDLKTAEIYGFGQSTSTAALTLSGWQDNGTNLGNGAWNQTMGGDGMLAFISSANNNNMWGSQYSGSLNRSTNGGASWATCNTPETGAWVTPWKESPSTPNTIYAGCNNMWKSTNGGATWAVMGTLPGAATDFITQFAVAPSNANTLLVIKGATVYKTTNGGTTWTPITTLPAGNATYVAFHNTNANKAWITYSGYNNQNKIFQTTDLGVTWTNLSASLPNIPINCVTYIYGSNDGLYIGTDNGVFYKDATLSVWQPFSGGLPNVEVTQIENYVAGSKLRCSTYGRGLWESGYYVPGTYAPVAFFGGNQLFGCPGMGVQYSDYSSGQPTSWQWTFPGGVPSSSTLQNPLVYYPTSGQYTVTLQATNGNGTNTYTWPNYINISTAPAAPVTTGASICAPGGIVNLSCTASPGTVHWWDQAGAGTLLHTGLTYSPSVATTTTFWVDETFAQSGSGSLGAVDNTIGAGAMFTANDIRGLYFDVLSPVVINTVDVYCNSAGNRTIEIIDPNGNTYHDTTIFIAANPSVPTTITINMKVYPGSGYMMKFRGLVDCFRNTAGGTYPYTSPSINITNSNAGLPGYYYFFYNWTYTNITCNSNRVPCVATVVNCTSTNELFSNEAFKVYPNPNNGLFDLSFVTDTRDNYSVKVYNALGQVVYSDMIENFTGEYTNKLDLTKAGSGMYSLQITNGKQQSIRKIVVY